MKAAWLWLRHPIGVWWVVATLACAAFWIGAGWLGVQIAQALS